MTRLQPVNSLYVTGRVNGCYRACYWAVDLHITLRFLYQSFLQNRNVYARWRENVTRWLIWNLQLNNRVPDAKRRQTLGQIENHHPGPCMKFIFGERVGHRSPTEDRTLTSHKHGGWYARLSSLGLLMLSTLSCRTRKPFLDGPFLL